MRRTRHLLSLVLGTIILAAILSLFILAIANKIHVAQQPPRDAEGSIAVVMCPACEQTFHNLLAGGGEIECALYDVGKGTAAVLASVDARVITDDKTNAAYGEPIQGSALMHNKFCIINSTIITSGSYNPTDGGAVNRNNLVIAHSPTLARNYAAQFDALSTGRREGAHEPLLYLGARENGSRIENYFCPRDGCEDKVITALSKAQSSIYFMTFSFTSNSIGDALLQARERGIIVEGMCDERQSRSEKQYSECTRLEATLWDGNGLLHHKVFIIDGETVVTGSYNPTASGTGKNNENILIVTDPLFAEAFYAEYLASKAQITK